MGATYNPNRRRLIWGNHDFVHINDQVLGAIQKDYNSSQNRLIIIDHEGALPRSINGDPQPSLYALKILDYLSRDKKNTVFVFSTH
jgi:trehalose-6-phosphatase